MQRPLSAVYQTGKFQNAIFLTLLGRWLHWFLLYRDDTLMGYSKWHVRQDYRVSSSLKNFTLLGRNSVNGEMYTSGTKKFEELRLYLYLKHSMRKIQLIQQNAGIVKFRRPKQTTPIWHITVCVIWQKGVHHIVSLNFEKHWWCCSAFKMMCLVFLVCRCNHVY